jgi:membrane fusion protein (multidrug efflux system)
MNTYRKIFIILGLFSLIACNDHHKIHHGGKFTVAHPWRQNVELTKEYVAQVKAIQHIELRAFEKGYLQNIYVDEGQFIEKDTEMFQIMPLIMQAEYGKAKAEYDVALIEYKNTKNLKNKNVVSSNELALVRAKLNKAKAELDLAKTHLNLTTIKAPFSGIMDRFQVRLGSLVEEGELLTTLSDISQIWVYFNVSEADYLDYMEKKKNDESVPVRLRLANGKLFDQVGKIDTIEADFNPETGNVAFRASFNNPNNLLRHGETGNILISEKLENQLVIPQKSTFEVLDKKYVYVINSKNKVKSKQIEVMHELPHLFVVASGINEEDVIITDGLGKVEVGQEVETDLQKPDQVMASLKLASE